MLSINTNVISNNQLDKINLIVPEIVKIYDALYLYLMCDVGRSSFKNTCRLGSYFSYLKLKENFPEFDFQINGGWSKDYTLKPDHTYLDLDCLPGGTWSENTQQYESHYWCFSNKYNFIIDFTASQFGYDPIYITDICDDSYISNLKKQLILDEVALAEIILQHPYKEKKEFKDFSEKDNFLFMINAINANYLTLNHNVKLEKEIKEIIKNSYFFKKKENLTILDKFM